MVTYEQLLDRDRTWALREGSMHFEKESAVHKALVKITRRLDALGIAARNGILLISHFRHLEQAEGVPFGPGLVLRGASERLSPIMMTALATALALVPLVLGGNRPGQEIEYPMAIVILGGLATSTLLNLFVLPVLYLSVGRRRRDRTGA